ncbi:hypothetical protein JCM8202_005259 [Rhodotorula sphaerocarpa]
MPPKASTSAAGAAAASAKKLSPVELKLLNAGLAARGGEMLQNELFAACGLSVSPSTMDAVNGLLRKGLAQMLRTASGQTMFRFLGKEEAKAMSSMDSEEKLVLNHIRDAGNMGIWSRTLTTKTGLPRATIAKALKVLEGKKTIKTVKSVKTPTRKIYMLTGIAPSVELTGGPWFTDNELDVELVETLKKVVRKYLHQKSQPPSISVTDPSTSESVKIKPIYPVTATPFLPTADEVLGYISKSGAAIVDLKKEHVEDLLDLMVFDGDVEKVLVSRLGPDGLPVNGAGGGAGGRNGKGASKANGKRKGKATTSGKRKKGAASSDEDELDSSDDDRGKKGKKGKKGSSGSKRAANGKAKRKRTKLDSDAESESSDDEESSDFDSDEDAATAKRKRGDAAGGGSDDDEEGGGKKNGAKRRKKRVKSRVKREEGDSSDDRDSGASQSEDEKAKPEPDAAEAGGEGTNTQFVYRMIRQYRPTIGWTDMPCGRCPVEEFCSEPPRRRAESFRRPAQAPIASALKLGGGPATRIEFDGGIQGIGMLGGAGAAIGVSDAKWGELKGGIGNGVAPVNPIDCPAYKEWLDF